MTRSRTVVGVLVGLACLSLGVGMEKPSELFTNFASPSSSHNYFYPSSFERVDTLNGKYNLIIPYISLPGDGDLAFSILGTYDYQATQSQSTTNDLITFYDTTDYTEAVNTPFGLGWKVMQELIRIDEASPMTISNWFVPSWFEENPYNLQSNRLGFQPYAVIHTQDGIYHQAFPCMGQDCRIQEGQWEETTDNVACTLWDGHLCRRRKEVFVTNDNWAIIATMERTLGDLRTPPWKHVKSQLKMPNGLVKEFTNISGCYDDLFGEECSPAEMQYARLTKLIDLHGNSIEIKYLATDDNEAENCLTRYGRCDLPSEVLSRSTSNTLPAEERKKYRVKFIYQDISWHLAQAISGASPCQLPGTFLKRIDVYHAEKEEVEETLLYSRYFNYFHYSMDAWKYVHPDSGPPLNIGCTWYGSAVMFLTNTFTLSPDASGNPYNSNFVSFYLPNEETDATETWDGHSLGAFLADKKPLGFWHFDTACYWKNDMGSANCSVLPLGWFYHQPINYIRTPNGGKITLDYYAVESLLDEDMYVTWDMNDWDGNAGNDEIVYDPDMQSLGIDPSGLAYEQKVYEGDNFSCNGSSRQAVAFYLPQLHQRMETHPDSSLFTPDRLDNFEYWETKNNGLTVRQAVIQTGLRESPYETDSNDCVCQMDNIDALPEDNMYWTRQEIDYFAHKSITGTNQIWKLFLPLEIRLYAQNQDGIYDPLEADPPTPLRRVIFNWSSIDQPLDGQPATFNPDAPEQQRFWEYRNNYYPFSGLQWSDFYSETGTECQIKAYYVDEGAKMPVLQSLTLLQDGASFVNTLVEPDQFGLPQSNVVKLGERSVATTRQVLNQPQLTLAEGETVQPPAFFHSRVTGSGTSMSAVPPPSNGMGAQYSQSILNPANLNLESLTRNNYRTEFSYDPRGNVATVKTPSQKQVSLSDYNFGRPGHLNVGGELAIDAEYDPLGPISSVALNGNTLVTFQYDALGNWSEIDRPGTLHGSSAEYFFTESMFGTPESLPVIGYHKYITGRRETTGNLVSETRVDGLGRPWRSNIYPKDQTIEDGIQTFAMRNACGRVSRTVSVHAYADVTLGPSRMQYFVPGHLGISRSFVDIFGRPVFSSDSSGAFTFYRYEPAGNFPPYSGIKISRTTGARQESWFRTASRYRSTTIETFLGPMLLKSESLGPLIESDQLTPNWGIYNDESAKRINYTYDDQGRVTKIEMKGPDSRASNPVISRTEYEYDEKNQVLEQRNTEKGIQKYSYDADRLLTYLERPGTAGIVHYHYDNAKRVTDIYYGNHTTLYHFDYDPGHGKLLEATGTMGPGVTFQRAFEYDPDTLFLTRMTEHYSLAGVNCAFETNYTYDDYGQVQSYDYEGGALIELVRNYLGQVREIRKDGANLVANVRYFPDGTQLRVDYGNGKSSDYYQVYPLGLSAAFYFGNTANRPARTTTSEIYKFFQGELYSANPWDYHECYVMQNPDWDPGVTGTTNMYALDNFLNPLLMEIGGYNESDTQKKEFQVTAHYDFINQLQQADYTWKKATSPFMNSSFSHDIFGNRLADSFSNGSQVKNTSYTYADNRLVSSVSAGSTTRFAYDSQGNMIRAGTAAYQFDFLNRLVSINNGKIRNYYDADGQLLIQQEPTRVTFYFYGAGGLTCKKEYTCPDFKLVSTKYYVSLNGKVLAEF